MNRSTRQHVFLDWTLSWLNSWLKKCTCGLFIHPIFTLIENTNTNKLTNKHHRWYHSFHTVEKMFIFAYDVVWRCERSRHLLSFLLCIVSVVLFCLCLVCVFIRVVVTCLTPVYTLPDLTNKPPYTLYSLSQTRSLSLIMSLLMPWLQVHHCEQRNCCKNSRFFLWCICVYLQRGQNTSCVGFNRLPDDLNNSSPRVTLSSLRTGRWHLLFALQERRASSRELDQNTHQTAADMGILP